MLVDNPIKDDIMIEYDVEPASGIVHARGRFEGSHWSTIALWGKAMEGMSDDTLYDEDDTPYDVFLITPSDREAYDIPEDIAVVVLWESEQGFVGAEWMNDEEYFLFEDQLLADEVLSDE